MKVNLDQTKRADLVDIIETQRDEYQDLLTDNRALIFVNNNLKARLKQLEQLLENLDLSAYLIKDASNKE